MSQQEKLVRALLEATGFPTAPGAIDFPPPGRVVRYYRERMVYQDATGLKHWTQRDLAEVLGISEVSVRLMETKDKGLNSMERRKVLADILSIPPILLGLGSLEDLAAYAAASSQQASLSLPHASRASSLSLFNDALNMYWNAHYMGMSSVATVSTVSKWTQHIQQEITGGHQQSLLCEWYLLLANMYADQRRFNDSFALLDDALKMARANEDKELEAAILYRVGHIHLDHHSFQSAADALSHAQRLIPYANAPLRGAISQTVGLAYAITAQTEADRLRSQRALEDAAKLTERAEKE